MVRASGYAIQLLHFEIFADLGFVLLVAKVAVLLTKTMKHILLFIILKAGGPATVCHSF